MQMYSKHSKVLLAITLILSLLLSACASQQGEDTAQETGPFTVTVRVTAAQDTLDPADSTAQGNETILFHLFENLMRWEDDGSGHAVLAPGQAESYTVETDYAGNATYTFTLRDDIQWSDGQAVTAGDFVAAWQRLADPANDLPHRALLADIAGYSDVQETGDSSLLGVSAPDDGTLVVNLVGSCAYFLEEVCAGAYTMPVRQDQVESGKWGGKDTVTNGAYCVASFTDGQVDLEKSETYYDSAAVGPDVLRFTPISTGQDYDALLNGEADLILDLPEEALQALADSGSWLPDPVTSTYGLLLNTKAEPFTDPNVRLALRLAIDTQAVAEAASDLTLRAASGLLPYGITDYGTAAPEAEEEETDTQSIPDPNQSEQPQEPDTFWDFRTHSLEMVTVTTDTDYDDACAQARSLLAQAGYPDGAGFPEVEYIYVSSDVGKAVTQAVTAMWQEQLGITVTARAVTADEYAAMLTPTAAEAAEGAGETDDTEEAESVAPFQIAAQDFTAVYSDAKAILGDFYSTNAGNYSGYASEAFDILMESAAAAVSPEARDAYLHDAEAILLNDAPVIPLYYEGLSWQLREGLSGLYRAPDGVFFLYHLSQGEAEA